MRLNRHSLSLFLTVIAQLILPYAPCLAQEEPCSIAIIPGEGRRHPGPETISLLEVELSKQSNLELVEREEIRKVINELNISAGKLTNTSHSLRLGEILGARILLFVERISTPDGYQDRYRLVESSSGIVLETVFDQARSSQAINSLLLSSIQRAVNKSKLPVESRHFLSILELRNTEPGPALNGPAEALRMFIEHDLLRAPDIFILDREHVQRLQDEKIISRTDPKLKATTILIDGGLQHTPGKTTLDADLKLHSMTGTQTARILVTESSDIQQLRRNIVQRLEEFFNTPHLPPASDQNAEADLFLKRVVPYIFAGQYEEAVQAAEVAHTLMPSLESSFWASRAWYNLGKSLSERLDVSFGQKRNRQRIPVDRSTYETGSQYTRPSSPSVNNQALPERRPKIITIQPSDNAIQEPSIPDKSSTDKLRMLESFLRAVNLAQEFTDRYINDFNNGRTDSLVIPDPFEEPNEPEFSQGILSDDEKTIWTLNPILNQETAELREAYSSLISAERSLLSTQRGFYDKNLDKNTPAATNYWTTWKREGKLAYYSNDPKRMLEFYRAVTGAFLARSDKASREHQQGLWNALRLPAAVSLHPDITALFNELTTSNESFMRMSANRMLLRASPTSAAQRMVNDFADSLDSRVQEPFFANFLRPAINHLSVYDPDRLLNALPPIIDNILKKNDPEMLAQWRYALWPLINALARADNKGPAADLIHNCQKIINQAPIETASNDVNLLRAELDLKLVMLSLKDKPDDILHRYFQTPDLPAHIRQRPEIEPPRPDGSLDLSGFGKLPMIYGQKYKSTISRSSSFESNQGGGISSYQSYQRVVDAEGNEIFSSHVLKAEPAAKIKGFITWAGYEIRKTSFNLTKTASETLQDRESKRPDRSVLADEGSIFEVVPSLSGRSISIKAFRHLLLPPSKKTLLGQAMVPENNGSPFYISSITHGSGKLFAGTSSSGVLIYDTSSTFPSKEPSSSLQPDHGNDQGVVYLNESNGLPNNHVLSLKFHEDMLYIAVGPGKGLESEIHGASGLVAYNIKSKSFNTLISSRALNGKSRLENGSAYQIKTILTDAANNCLWLAIGGNKDLNGIWRYDLSTGNTEQHVKEIFSIEEMQWAGKNIVYTMLESGWSVFDIETSQKRWLLGYAASPGTGNLAATPPNGVAGRPSYGSPQLRLCPFIADSDETIISTGWDAFSLHQTGKNSLAESIRKLDPEANYISNFVNIIQNRHSIYVITGSGQVFQLIKLNDTQQ